MNFKEMPECRKSIDVLLQKHHCSLEDLLSGKYCILGKGLRIQCKKMLGEREGHYEN